MWSAELLSIDALKEQWRKRGATIAYAYPTFTEHGLIFGASTVLARRRRSGEGGTGPDLERDAERAIALLAITYRVAPPPRLIGTLRRATKAWEDGDKCLAHVHLAFANLHRLENQDDAWRLFLAEALLDGGMEPSVLVKTLGLGPPISKDATYNDEQPRNPAGSGRASGEWAKNPAAGDASPSVALVAPTVPSLVRPLTLEVASWLLRFVRFASVPTIYFGAIFIPSRNEGIFSEGTVPGQPDVSYRVNHDQGTLRLGFEGDNDPEHSIVAQIGSDGVYREVESGVMIARSLGDGTVLLDSDLVRDLKGSDEAVTLPQLEPDKPAFMAPPRDDPKLCPDPGRDHGGSRRRFDELYSQYVRDIVNPQRVPQLPPKLTFALPNPTSRFWVHYDDCRESNGNMIEAKSDKADFVLSKRSKYFLGRRYLEQADRQVLASQGRHLEWYFHRKENADLARAVFEKAGYGQKITVHYLPYPYGVPNPNPRVR